MSKLASQDNIIRETVKFKKSSQKRAINIFKIRITISEQRKQQIHSTNPRKKRLQTGSKKRAQGYP